MKVSKGNSKRVAIYDKKVILSKLLIIDLRLEAPKSVKVRLHYLGYHCAC